ncbi:MULTISPECIES: rhomboid family intramembrane serine protease [unclassified Thermococcus]|uniref:rhomboid family intramembrane serine protease n=1 Tax=unclassified Thermococcus TaxID=2627626 RepID=UPI00143B374B|nr:MULTISPECIES: rhomboid family intramembrane serine protease [unclassified Thermococcus]
MPKLTKERLYFVMLFTLITIIMVVLYLAPPSLQEKLALNYQGFSFSNPADWLRLYTMHFVHENFPHLLSNLITFAVIFPLLYFLAEFGNSLDSYRRLLVFVFILLPPVIALLDLFMMRRLNLSYNMGFSGIDSALIGAVPYFSANILKRKLEFNISPTNFSKFFTLIAGGLIALTYGFSIIGAPLLFMGILAITYFILIAFRESKKEKSQKLKALAVIITVFVVVVAGIWMAFPKELVGSSGIVDIFIHYLGLVSTLYFFPLIEDTMLRKPQKKDMMDNFDYKRTS